MDALARIKARIIPQEDGCWLWRGAIEERGYAVVRYRGRKRKVAHVLYEALHGPPPAGLTHDHLCRRRACVNPAHIEAVPHGENVRRGLPYRGRDDWRQKREKDRQIVAKPMTLTAAAAERGVDPSALRHAIRRGRLEATKDASGREWLVTRAALRAYDRLQGPRPEGFVTASEAGRRIGRSRQRIHQMIAAGQIPARRTKEGRVLIPESALLAEPA